jgi:hypothetical protein
VLLSIDISQKNEKERGANNDEKKKRTEHNKFI